MTLLSRDGLRMLNIKAKITVIPMTTFHE